MTNFTDNRGEVWTIDITYADVERVKQHMTGADGKPLDLLEIAEQGDFSPISGNVRRVLDTVFWLCLEQIQERFDLDTWNETHSNSLIPCSETPLQKAAHWFSTRIGSEEILKIVSAWEVAMINFIPNRRIREAVTKVLEQERTLQTKAYELAEKECLKDIADGLAKLSGNLPENSESTPIPTASDS